MRYNLEGNENILMLFTVVVRNSEFVLSLC